MDYNIIMKVLFKQIKIYKNKDTNVGSIHIRKVLVIALFMIYL